jgi:hypothetical protein
VSEPLPEAFAPPPFELVEQDATELGEIWLGVLKRSKNRQSLGDGECEHLGFSPVGGFELLDEVWVANRAGECENRLVRERDASQVHHDGAYTCSPRLEATPARNRTNGTPGFGVEPFPSVKGRGSPGAPLGFLPSLSGSRHERGRGPQCLASARRLSPTTSPAQTRIPSAPFRCYSHRAEA